MTENSPVTTTSTLTAKVSPIVVKAIGPVTTLKLSNVNAVTKPIVEAQRKTFKM